MRYKLISSYMRFAKVTSAC